MAPQTSAISDVGEGVEQTGDEEQEAHVRGVDAHHVGVKHHEEHHLKHEGEVVAEVTEQVAKLVPPSKWPNSSSLGRC